jgi:hypothetical protein
VRARLNILCALRLFGCASLLLAAVCAASPKWRQAAWSVEESSAPHFDSFIPATRCSCTAPCKEQAGNRESSSAPLFYIHRLVLRSCNRSGHRAPLSLRHGRACPGHPRLRRRIKKRRGCPAAQTSLRSLRKLDCVAGHDDVCRRLTRMPISRPVAELRSSPLFTFQTAHLVPAAHFLRPGFCLFASPSPYRGVAERRETFGCSGTRWTRHDAACQAPSEAPCVP